MARRTGVLLSLALLGVLPFGCSKRPPPESGPPKTASTAAETPTRARLERLVLPKKRVLPRDSTNRFADDPRAAALGHKLFFDARFSGQLLDEANTGEHGTLGKRGEAGKVACASCHVPGNRAFVDTRSTRRQLSLAAAWTHRRTPSLLDVGQVKFLMWDGRRDTFFGQAFIPIESPLEFNSSRLFLAKQVQRLYRAEYEPIFGPMPSLDQYPDLEPNEAGCTRLPSKPARNICEKPGHNDESVVRIVVNFGKAMQAYLRQLSCGRSRFDAWIEGDASALNADERAGAELFVGKAGCDSCHSGPYLTDQKFHNLGLPGRIIPFTGVNSAGDQGAALGIADLRETPLNSAGRYSDGNDGRLKELPGDPSGKLGAFRTPSLRCVSRRPSFMHDGQFRSLRDVVAFFSRGGAKKGTTGSSEITPRNFTDKEIEQLVAFLKALDGSGPEPALLKAPTLP